MGKRRGDTRGTFPPARDLRALRQPGGARRDAAAAAASFSPVPTGPFVVRLRGRRCVRPCRGQGQLVPGRGHLTRSPSVMSDSGPPVPPASQEQASAADTQVPPQVTRERRRGRVAAAEEALPHHLTGP